MRPCRIPCTGPNGHSMSLEASAPHRMIRGARRRRLAPGSFPLTEKEKAPGEKVRVSPPGPCARRHNVGVRAPGDVSRRSAHCNRLAVYDSVLTFAPARGMIVTERGLSPKVWDNWLSLLFRNIRRRLPLKAADRIGLRGIVSKKAAMRHRSRSKCDWIKVKCPSRRERNRDRWRLFERP